MRMPNICEMASPSTTHLRLVMAQVLSTTGPAHAKQQDAMISAWSPALLMKCCRASSMLEKSRVCSFCTGLW